MLKDFDLSLGVGTYGLGVGFCLEGPGLSLGFGFGLEGSGIGLKRFLPTNPLQLLDQKPGIHCHRVFETLNQSTFQAPLYFLLNVLSRLHRFLPLKAHIMLSVLFAIVYILFLLGLLFYYSVLAFVCMLIVRCH